MARKIKFALEMKDGEQVRNIEDLRKYFDLDKVVGYFLDGRLLTWLNDRYYEEEALSIEELSKDDVNLNKKICEILGVGYEDEELDIEAIALHNEKLAKLKQYTADEKIIAKVDSVAFDQEDLGDLLDEGISEIYLCQNKFAIPLRQKNKKYIGIGKVEAVIKSKTEVNFDELNIQFVNVKFNEEYNEVINTSYKNLDKVDEDFIEDSDCTNSDNDDDYYYGNDYKVDEKTKTLYDGFIELGEKAEEDGDYDKAICFYKKAENLIEDAQVFYSLGCCYRQNNDFEKAMEYFKKIIEIGSEWNDDYYGKAANLIGTMYANGEGVAANMYTALDWYKKAADKQNVSAAYKLGCIYQKKYGNTEETIKWYRIAATNIGDDTNLAMKELGLIYYEKKNMVLSRYWYEQAVEKGNFDAPVLLGDLFEELYNDYYRASVAYEIGAYRGNTTAMNNLGYDYANGEGIIKDYSKAIYWYRNAAEKGNITSMKNLAYLYQCEDNYDPEKANYWLKRAANAGDKDAIDKLNRV